MMMLQKGMNRVRKGSEPEDQPLLSLPVIEGKGEGGAVSLRAEVCRESFILL